MSQTDEFGNPIGDADYEEHAHEVKSPITEAFARERLNSFSLDQLHEIAKADGLYLTGNRGEQIKSILLAWFSPAEGVAGRIISFQELLDQAENLPQGDRRVWRKQTHGKEMGFVARKIIP